MLAWAGLFGLSVLVVGLVLLFLWHLRMGELFHRHVRDRPKRRLFLAAVGFFLTLALARGAAMPRRGGLPHFITSTSAAPTCITWFGGFCCCWRSGFAG